MHVHTVYECICIHNDHDITQIIALEGFNVFLNDDICYTYEHFYTIAGQISNLTMYHTVFVLPVFSSVTSDWCIRMSNNMN